MELIYIFKKILIEKEAATAGVVTDSLTFKFASLTGSHAMELYVYSPFKLFKKMVFNNSNNLNSIFP